MKSIPHKHQAQSIQNPNTAMTKTANKSSKKPQQQKSQPLQKKTFAQQKKRQKNTKQTK